ncbi:MAG: DUF1684 domain-containing protein [Deltaproteobacteria bacterium]|nr:DUF1684 domain-containing protein [Deltaproteobacteria bacterium]
MGGDPYIGRKWLQLLVSCLSLFLWAGSMEPSLSIAAEDPLDRREEKIRVFREKRDLFFKEDSNSPLKESARKKFKGLLYYPIDLKYAVTGVIEKSPTDPKPLYANLPTNKERDKKYVKYGRFKFKLEGKEYLLQIYRPLGGGDFFLPFKDKTSGSETYPEGRYLYIEPMLGGKVLIDFNRASNPFCEYSEKFTCSFAPKENWLDIEIRVGEKRYR